MAEEPQIISELDDSWDPSMETAEEPNLESALNPTPEPEEEDEEESNPPAQSPDPEVEEEAKKAEDDEDEEAPKPKKAPKKPADEKEEEKEPEAKEEPEAPEKATEDAEKPKDEVPEPVADEEADDPELGIPNKHLDKELEIEVLGKKELRSVRDIIATGKQAEEINTASRKRFQEAAHYTRSAKQAVDMLMENPLTAAIQLWTGHLGGDRDAAEQQVLNMIKPGIASLMQEALEEDPNRRNTMRTNRRNAEEINRYRAEAQRRQQDQETEQQKAATEAAEQQIQEASTDLGVEMTDTLRKQTAFVYSEKSQQGVILTAKQAINLALETFSPQKLKRVEPDLSKIDPEKILSNPDLVAKLRAAEKKRAEAARSSNRVIPPTANQASKRSSRRDGVKAQKSLEEAFNKYW